MPRTGHQGEKAQTKKRLQGPRKGARTYQERFSDMKRSSVRVWDIRRIFKLFCWIGSRSGTFPLNRHHVPIQLSHVFAIRDLLAIHS